jgi:hypothetical protein
VTGRHKFDNDTLLCLFLHDSVSLTTKSAMFAAPSS